MGSIGSTGLLFESLTDIKAPFFAKAVLKMFVDEDPTAFGKLKECKGTPVLTPALSVIALLPDVKNFSDIFKTAKLKANAGSIQLKESFPKISSNLLTEEHHAHVRLGRHLTLLLIAEVKMLRHPDEKEWAVAAKLAFASFGGDLASFIRIMRKCRSAVFERAGLKLEPKHLIESSCFCKGLFPEKEVEQFHDLTQHDNVSLVNRWQMLANVVSSSSSPSASGQKRRFSGPSQFSGHSGQSSSTKRRPTSSTAFKSRATNDAFERPHKNQPSYQQRRADHSVDQKPPTSSGQSHGGKSFRGLPSKGNSSN